MNYTWVQNGARWQGLALSALRTGGKPAWDPNSARASHPSSLPTFPRGPPSRASCLSLGQLEPCQPPPYNEDLLSAQLSTPRLGEASTPQPEAGLVPPKHGSAPCTCLPQPLHKGAELGFWKGAGREGQLVTDLSTAELGDAFQDRAVHPTVSAQMAQLRPTEGRARYRATRQRIIIAIIVLACI